MSNAAERLYERVLVVRCQSGDELALAELIARYSPPLRFYLRKMAGDGIADDLLQDVWMDVFTRITRLRDCGAFSAWIYRIARDKAWRELRRRPIPPVAVDDGPGVEAADVQQEWTAEDIELVRAALDILAAEHREVLLLRFVENMSYEQVAAVVATPLGTVRSRIHYAKAALRAEMDKKYSRKDVRS